MIYYILDAFYIWIAVFLLPRWALLAPLARRYRAGAVQRLGFVPDLSAGRYRLWIHCASVGEASIPRHMVEIMKKRHESVEFVFSACTDTGVERLRNLYPDDEVFYFPCDFSPCVRKALKRIKPSTVFLVEQEIWPQMLQACNVSGIPVAIINGRMNESSSRFVRCLFRIFPGAKDGLKLCCARSKTDAERFAYAGLEREKITNTGSMKYEAMDTTVSKPVSSALSDSFGIIPGEKILVGGSTHNGEEKVLAHIWRRLRESNPSLRLIIVPRHVERASAIAAELGRCGFRVQQKTLLEDDGPELKDTIILVDTIGELTGCYELADVVFVGNSLFPPGGGQNMLEPAALGKPVLTGVHTSNFAPEMDILVSGKALETVRDEAELEAAVCFLLAHEDEARTLGARAQEVVAANRGATERTVKALEEYFWPGSFQIECINT